jgi:hypothetical protein
MRFLFIINLSFIFNLIVVGQTTDCDWTSKRPIDEFYYTGIGNSSLENSNYIEIARNNALNDLSAEIITIVKSNTDYSISEENEIVSESFQQNTSIHTSGLIQGYEVVETCTKDGYYWIYLRLNKEEYVQKSANLIDETVELVSRILDEGIDYEKKMNVSSAFNSYVSALNVLRTFTNSHLIFNFSESIRLVEKKVINKLTNLSQNIVFDSFENVYSVSFDDVFFTISGLVLYKKIPVGNIPVFIISNNVELNDYNLLSDSKTGLNIHVKNIFDWEEESRLEIRIDYRRMISTSELERSVNGFVNNLMVNNKIISLKIKPKTVFIETETKILSQDYYNLENSLKEIFQKGNQRIVNNKNEADYIIRISSDTRKGNVIKELGVVIALLACDISIKDQNGNHIYSRFYNNIRGTKQDYSEASMDAYRKLLEEINKNMKEINAVLR